MKAVGAGSAVVTLPTLAAGCGPKSHLKGGGGGTTPRGAHTLYFEQFGVSRELLRKTLARGLARGGDFSEIFLQHKVSHWLGMEDGQVNRAYSRVMLGAGIRVLKGDATGFAYCEDLTEEALLRTAAVAATVADGTPRVRPSSLAAVPIQSQYAVELPWSEVGVDRKLPLVQQAEKIARGRDPRIVKVTVFLEDNTSRILVANSEGRLVEDDQPMTTLSVRCTAKSKGQTESSGRSVAAMDDLSFYQDKVIRQCAQEAADHTTLLFGAGSPPVGDVPVVLAPGVTGILLHEAIGHGMEADFNRKGTSIYADRIGKPVAPKDVTILDDGVSPKRFRGSINIDDEGNPAQKTVLVERGILRSYMHDRIAAKHYGSQSTGSGRRQSFRFPPNPRMRNTYMLAGPRDPQEIIRGVKRGLYAEKFTNGQVMIGAGDFTFYLKHGRLIEDGKLTRVVKDANLIGNGPKVLEHVDQVGNDLVMHSGAGYCGKDGQRVPVGFGLPTVRCGAISVGGRKA
jgi:TldD protein